MAPLAIYLLNVGQADTSVIQTPGGNIIVIDAVSPKKLTDLLSQLRPDGEIAQLIITHPHDDHYRGADGLLDKCHVQRATLAPFWQEPGPTGYHAIINRLSELQVPTRFLSGYERLYPDGGNYPEYEDSLLLELLGPSNNTLDELARSNTLEPNHLSIISRLCYGRFTMVFAADAQMENWQHFDEEGLLEKKCTILRAAHHGSKRGSQWERIERLSPSLVVVSSDPNGEHDLPDLVGSVIFYEFSNQADQDAVLTYTSGTIRIEVSDPETGQRTIIAYGDSPDDLVFSGQPGPLPETDWTALVETRLAAPS
jgi:competence protein ComEC